MTLTEMEGEGGGGAAAIFNLQTQQRTEDPCHQIVSHDVLVSKNQIYM